MKLFVLDIAIEGSTVSRRVRIPADLTLADLHTVIQATLGWQDDYPHRFKLGSRAGAKDIDAIFTAPDTSIGYLYDERYAVTVTSVGVELGGQRSNEDFVVLTSDPGADAQVLTARLRNAFVTVAYHADRQPTFTRWGNREDVALFDHAVELFLKRRDPNQAAPVLRERAKLQSLIEELLATPSMTILREAAARLQGEGLARGEAIDALVALAASFPGDVTDVREQVAFLNGAQQLTKAIYTDTFAGGPSAVIAMQLALKTTRDRNKRRRKRR